MADIKKNKLNEEDLDKVSGGLGYDEKFVKNLTDEFNKRVAAGLDSNCKHKTLDK